MKQCFLSLVLAALLLTPVLSPAAQVQQRMSSSQIEMLEEQVKEQRTAYQRYALAEQEATEDGALEFAKQCLEAKNKAYEVYAASNARLQAAKAQHSQRKARAEISGDYR